MMTEDNDTESSLIQRILIADDHSIVRRGIKHILLTGFSALDLGEADSGQAVLEAVGSRHWDLLILDLSLPDRSGLDIMPELRRLAPDLRVLVLTMHAEEQYALRLFRSGVSGYLTKDSATDRLIEAATKVLAGGKYLSPEMAERMALALDTSFPRAPHETLSTREFEVMRLIASGLETAQIAGALSLRARTVATYRRRILQKLNLKTTQQIVYYAHHSGFVDWPRRQPASYSMEASVM